MIGKKQAVFRGLPRFVLVMAAATIVACQPEESATSKKVISANSGSLASPVNEAKASGSDSPLDTAKIDEQLKGLFKVTYHIALSISGPQSQKGSPSSDKPVDLCSGNVDFAINPSITQTDLTKILVITYEIPFNCGFLGSIDIAKLLKPIFVSSGNSKNNSVVPLKANGAVLAITSLGTATFNPPRPIVPSLAASDAATLSALNVSEAVTVTTDTGSASGTASVVMNSFNQHYKPPMMNLTFNHAMHFVTTAEGFEGIGGLKALSLEKLEFRVNTNPIAILAIGIYTRLDKVIGEIIEKDSFKFEPSALTGLLAALPSVQKILASDFPGRDILLSTVKDVSKNLYLNVGVDLVNQEGVEVTLGDEAKEESLNGKPL